MLVPRVGDWQWKQATVAGVVPDVQYGTPGAVAAPTIYASYIDAPPTHAVLIVRTDGNSAAIAPTVRSILHGLDPRVVPYDVKTMRERVDGVSSPARFGAFVLGAYAAGAL